MEWEQPAAYISSHAGRTGWAHNRDDQMRVVIYNTKSGLYFKAPDRWVKNQGEAFVFADKSTAIKFYETHYLPDTKILELSEQKDRPKP
jgi:hypothetical protein